MTTIIKTNDFPSTTLMENFKDTDLFFEKKPFKSILLPSVNIRDKKSSYEVKLAAPGFKKDDFKITTTNNILSISAETSDVRKQKKENYTRKEFSFASFTRSFTMPENATKHAMDARYKNGLLTIEIKKTGKKHPEGKQIKIK